MPITTDQFTQIKSKADKLGASLSAASGAKDASDAAHTVAATADADAVLKDAAKDAADAQVSADFFDLKSFIDGLV